MIACDMQPKLAQSANTGTAAPGPACDQSIEDGLVDPLLSQSGVEEIARRAPGSDDEGVGEGIEPCCQGQKATLCGR